VSAIKKSSSRSRTAIRLAVEDFVFDEASRLDVWDLDGWLTLFTQDCRYEVTPTGVDDPFGADARSMLFLIGDNRERLEQRVIRLNKKSAHVEFPKSKTRHLYTNVRIVGDIDETIVAMVNCCTFRTKNRITTHYPGSIRYRLRPNDDGFLIREKRVALDLDALIPQGKVSIIL
jgi:p-cumate 2,3-dioxygenase beta subunit